MDYARFQVAVIELAASGVPLTVANVVAHLRIDPDLVERDLDRMARDGRVDVEVDEANAAVVYRVRGLSTSMRPSRSSFMTDDDMSPMQREHASTSPKSVTMAVLLGALFPGVGLAYSAPLGVVVIATIVIGVFGKLLGSSLLVGPLYWMTSVIVSAILGGLYAARFNQEGHRARLYR